MKKYLYFILISLFTYIVNAQEYDGDLQFVGRNFLNGKPLNNTKIKVVSGSTKSSDADKQAVTNANGIATFSLNFTELNIFESKTELSFAVFYKVGGAEFVAPGSTSVTVKRNDEKKIDLTIPI